MHPVGQTWLQRAVFSTVYYNLRLWQRVTVAGLEHLPSSGSGLLISNHPSYLDPPAIYTTTIRARRVHFMAWDHLFRVPMVGWICRNFDAFPVCLERADRDSYRQASRLLKQGEVIGIFPEGGRSPRDGFHPSKRGGVRLAIRHQSPIIPCVIFGARQSWPKGQTRPRPGKIHIQLLPMIQPPAQAATPKLRAAQELGLMKQLHCLVNQQLIARGEIDVLPPHAWEVAETDNGQQT